MKNYKTLMNPEALINQELAILSPDWVSKSITHPPNEWYMKGKLAAWALFDELGADGDREEALRGVVDAGTLP